MSLFMSIVPYIAIFVGLILTVTNLIVLYLTYLSFQDTPHRDFHPPISQDQASVD